MLLGGIAAAAAPAWRLLHGQKRVLHEVERDYRRWMEKALLQRGEFSILGNSMVAQRLDMPHLSAIAAPRRCVQLSSGGTEPLHWLLYLKNLIPRIEPPPRLVFIFFRDYDFHHPATLHGPQLEHIEVMRQPGDEAFFDTGGNTGLRGVWKTVFREWFEVPQWRARQFERIRGLSLDVASTGKLDDDGVAAHVEELFERHRFRPEALDAGGLANDAVDSSGVGIPFKADPSVTLLPWFLSTARELGVRLVFYRVKRRPDAKGIRHQEPPLAEYVSRFRAWAEREGCGFVDEIDDPRITQKLFADGDHLHEWARPKYAEWFWKRAEPWLKLPAPEPAPAA